MVFCACVSTIVCKEAFSVRHYCWIEASARLSSGFSSAFSSITLQFGTQ
jgi:hypothetical protein